MWSFGAQAFQVASREESLLSSSGCVQPGKRGGKACAFQAGQRDLLDDVKGEPFVNALEFIISELQKSNTPDNEEANFSNGLNSLRASICAKKSASMPPVALRSFPNLSATGLGKRNGKKCPTSAEVVEVSSQVPEISMQTQSQFNQPSSLW